MIEIKCDGITAQDCWECEQYFQSSSLHYCPANERKVSNVSCEIGGNRTFDENGEWINKIS